MSTIGERLNIGQEIQERSVIVISPTVFAEGRVGLIELDPTTADEIKLLSEADPTSPVVLRFMNALTGRYVNFFDHRAKSIKAFREGGVVELFTTFSQVPCLASCRKKTGQYFVLADIGDTSGPNPISDGGPSQSLVLTTLGILNRMNYRVCRGKKNDALHPATGICLAESRPLKG